MPLPELVGHEIVRGIIGQAFIHGSLPQSLLLHGPAGSGKERLGLWLAQMLVCDRQTEEPCGVCRPCRSVLKLEHPDVHWFFPLPRPESTSAEKLRDRLEEARAAELQLWRETPLRVPAFERPPAHFLASVRTMQQLAAVRPAAGSRKVFVVGDAELMVPQESSPEAANAFLKLLEEPPVETTMILTASQPGALLPTIRSRVLALRVAPLAETDIARILVAEGLANPEDAARIARRSRGSLRTAVRIATSADDADSFKLAGRKLLLAALALGPVARLATAIEQRPMGARNDLVAQLDALSDWLRDLAAVSAGSPGQVADPADVPILERAVLQRKVSVAGALLAIDRVMTARDLAMGNVNPQLIVADLLRQVQRDLLGPTEPARTSA